MSDMLKILTLSLILLTAVGPVQANTQDQNSTVIKPVPLSLPPHHFAEEIPALAQSKDGKSLYVFNRGKNALLEVDKQGHFIQEIGHGLFKTPHGLRVDQEGNIWTTDLGTHLVLKFSPKGKILMVIGKKNTGSEGWFHKDYKQIFLNKPSDIAFDPDGNIYIADGGNYRIVVYSKGGDYLYHFGSKGSEKGQFNFPHAVIFNKKGQLLVADRENKRIQIFSKKGGFITAWDQVGYAYSLAYDPQGHLWMTDARTDQLKKISPDGKVIYRFGSAGKSPGKYGFLHGLLPTEQGIYLSDILNWKVEFLLWPPQNN